MKNKQNGFMSLISLFFLVTLACNLNGNPSATEAPVVDVASDAPSPAPVSTVQHLLIPPLELPSVQSGLAGDSDSSISAAENRAPSGDRFTFGRFERPFNSTSMDIYYPNLDILNTIFYQDDTWIFSVMILKSQDSNQSLGGKYGFEIDLDVDGGGDWLFMTLQPSSTEWTTEGVELWFDTNDDVGGTLKALTDNEPLPGDGYETMIFGNGLGDDLDLAWVRISPEDPNQVEMAVKLSLLDGDTTFLVGMWAGGEDFAPALFDVNDLFTHEQAGTSLKELEFFYPIKEVSELDNSCRMAVGFQPTGNEPGLCETLVPVRPGDPAPPPGCQLDPASCANMGTGWYFDAPSCSCKPFIIN